MLRDRACRSWLVLAALSGACRTATPEVARVSATPVPTVADTQQYRDEPPADALLGGAPVGNTESALVVRVVDGDTIVVDRGRGEEKVRYIGVDTPETVHPRRQVERMGPEASLANAALVAGHTVILEVEVSDVDRYGRLLRHVWVRAEGSQSLRHVGLALIRDGNARAVSYPPDDAYHRVFASAEASAREHGIGIWRVDDSADALPWEVDAPYAENEEEPETEQPETGCHPSYTPCLPVVDDLDCPEVKDLGRAPVRVIGNDQYRLDGDDDGVGCEK